jgi:hypothetical protein
MDSQITLLLESTSPQDRKKAIKMLVQHGGSETLVALGRLYKSEQDAEIKELALKAGRYLKKQQAEASDEVTDYPAPLSSIPQKTPSNSKTPPPPAEDDSDIATEYPAPMSDIREAPAAVRETKKEFKPVSVSAYKQGQAKSLMERALDFSVRGYRGEAIELLIKAFHINPNLRLDTYYMRVAMNITRMDQEDTLYLIDEDPKERKARLNAKPAKQVIRDDLRWNMVLQNLGIAYVALVLLMTLAVFIHTSIRRAGLARIRPLLASGCETCSGSEIRRMTELAQYTQRFDTMTPVHIMIHGVIIATVLIALLMIYHSFVYLAARMMLNKAGTYRGVLHHGMLPILIGYGAMLAIMAVYLFLVANEPYDPNYLFLTARKATFSAGPFPQAFLVAALVCAFAGTGYFSDRISKYCYINARQGQMITMRASFFFALLLMFGVVVLMFLAHLFG